MQSCFLSAAGCPSGSAAPHLSQRCTLFCRRPSWPRNSSSGRGPAERPPLPLRKLRRCCGAAAAASGLWAVMLVPREALRCSPCKTISQAYMPSWHQLLNVQRTDGFVRRVHAKQQSASQMCSIKIRVKRVPHQHITTKLARRRARRRCLPSVQTSQASAKLSRNAGIPRELPSPQFLPCRAPGCTPCESGSRACRQSGAGGRWKGRRGCGCDRQAPAPAQAGRRAGCQERESSRALVPLACITLCTSSCPVELMM